MRGPKMLLKVDCLPNAVGKQPSIPLINLGRKWTLGRWCWWFPVEVVLCSQSEYQRIREIISFWWTSLYEPNCSLTDCPEWSTCPGKSNWPLVTHALQFRLEWSQGPKFRSLTLSLHSSIGSWYSIVYIRCDQPCQMQLHDPHRSLQLTMNANNHYFFCDRSTRIRWRRTNVCTRRPRVCKRSYSNCRASSRVTKRSATSSYTTHPSPTHARPRIKLSTVPIIRRFDRVHIMHTSIWSSQDAFIDNFTLISKSNLLYWYLTYYNM